jgi:zinc protease
MTSLEPRIRRGVRLWMRLDITASLLLALSLLLVSATRPAHAMQIKSVKSPGGIEAWLVEDHSVPMMALRFAFLGGSSQDPKGKDGVANYITAMMDEGAGDLTSEEFQERMEEIAMRMSYEDTKDTLYGNFETLTAARDKAVELLRLAMTKPRFDQDAVERIRGQLMANLAYADRDPERVASRRWYEMAFAGHPYARPANGTPETVQSITRDDLAAYHKRIFNRGSLKVVAVGDVDAATLGAMLDRIFGELPASGELTPVDKTVQAGGAQQVIEMNVPQSVAVFGLPSIPRKDPDFMAAFIINQIVGGGGFASRLMEEVREKRGLAYSVYTYLQPTIYASMLNGGVATKNEAMAQSLGLIRAELKRMAEDGPTETELDNTKKFLIGSYALRFDTNAKIASQLLAIQLEGLGIDYVDRRNAEVEAVTLADAKRVAKRLLNPDNLSVTIVGKPVGLDVKG